MFAAEIAAVIVFSIGFSHGVMLMVLASLVSTVATWFSGVWLP